METLIKKEYSEELRKEIKELIKKIDLDCSIEEFKDKVDWGYISIYQKLSREFIREFQDNIHWLYISRYQELSKDFLKEFENKVDWGAIIKNVKTMKNLLMN